MSVSLSLARGEVLAGPPPSLRSSSLTNQRVWGGAGFSGRVRCLRGWFHLFRGVFPFRFQISVTWLCRGSVVWCVFDILFCFGVLRFYFFFWFVCFPLGRFRWDDWSSRDRYKGSGGLNSLAFIFLKRKSVTKNKCIFFETIWANQAGQSLVNELQNWTGTQKIAIAVITDHFSCVISNLIENLNLLNREPHEWMRRQTNKLKSAINNRAKVNRRY